ncbi:MAG: sigma-54 dependent transcriptional regulator [bacterium]|nr:sigma-54 dependent transcriptional regulator [bacterium]
MDDISNTRILIVDDEQVVRDSLREWFAEDGYHVTTAAGGVEALTRLATEPADLLLIDIKMPGMDGLELQRRVKQAAPEATVIIITAYAAVDTAVQALKAGAYDYITKPIDPDDLARVISKAAAHQRLARENVRLRERIDAIAEGDMPEIVGDSPAMDEVRRMTATIAETDATVLITGESGTGKELVARAIHRGSHRRNMSMVSVNCAGLPEGLIESELFGHEKGAFTGATYQRKGKFELADGGTLFFDEIGDISAKTQIDLLRALDDKRITRVGGTRVIPVDFRVIAATHRDLARAVEEEEFRLDLFYRFNVFTIELPPLRTRPSDIPLLAQHFLQRFARSMNRRANHFAPEALQRLQAYEWPGNVRELENAVERAVVLQRGEAIGPQDLPLPICAGEPPGPEPQTLAEIEHRHIECVLGATAGNVSRAARILGIDRVTLYSKIRKYDIPRQRTS